MAVDTPGVPAPNEMLVALVENLDPEVRDAIDDVDRTLIALALSQSPWDRLRSASRTMKALVRIRDAAAPEGH
jgi:hypothetical protein